MSSDQGKESSREWLRLHAEQLSIRGQIDDASDAEQRQILLERFARNRDAIAAIEGSEGNRPQPLPVDDVAQADQFASTATVSPSTGEPPDDDGVAVDDLFASLGLSDGPPEPVTTVPPVGSAPTEDSDSRLWAALAGAVGVVVLLGIGGALWLRGSDDGTETAAQGGGEVATTNAPADLNEQAAELSTTLERLGFSMVELDVRGDVIHLSGIVPTEQDLSTIRTAALSSVDPAALNMSEVEVMAGGYDSDETAAPPPGQPAPGAPRPPPGGRPGAPPPGFVPPTPEQQENLQKELNRVLTETPLVFEVGSTSLNELQLTVLDSVIIDLLEAHPGVPVRLVGYTDESGGEFDNSLLSFARANAVRDYLISRGVPEFVLRAEGRGEEDATGEAGADRRVEIEVITGPTGP